MKSRSSVGRVLEQRAPLIAFIVGAIAGWHFGWLHILSVSWAHEFISNVILADAIFVAYLFGIIAVLPALNEKQVIQKIREWGWYKVLVGFIGSAVWSALVVLALSLLTFALPPSIKERATFDAVFSTVWWGALAYVSVAVCRATHLMLRLLTAY